MTQFQHDILNYFGNQDNKGPYQMESYNTNIAGPSDNQTLITLRLGLKPNKRIYKYEELANAQGDIYNWVHKLFDGEPIITESLTEGFAIILAPEFQFTMSIGEYALFLTFHYRLPDELEY